MQHNTSKLIIGLILFIVMFLIGTSGLVWMFDISIIFYLGILLLVGLFFLTNLCSFVVGLYLSESLLRRGGELTTGYRGAVDEAQAKIIQAMGSLGVAMIRHKQDQRETFYPPQDQSDVFTLPEGGFTIED